MRLRNTISYVIPAVFVLVITGCSNTRFLTGDQMLYSGRNKISIINKGLVEEEKSVTAIAKNVSYYKPNNSLFGNKRSLPPVGLWSYNYLKPKGDGKLASWFYKTLSGEPVLISEVNPDLRCRKIETELFNTGFFNSKAWSVLDTNKRNPRKAKISYFVEAGNPYRIGNISFATPVDAVDSIINSQSKKLTFESGDIFNLEKVKTQEQRTVSSLIEQGYYFFKPDNLQIIADTIETPLLIDIMISKNNDLPDYIYQKYSIDKIKVNLSGTPLNNNVQTVLSDSLVYGGIMMQGVINYIKPEVISRSIMFRTGDLYSYTNHQSTIRKLNNNGVFRSVRIQFTAYDTINRKMDLLINLSAMNDVSLNLEGNIESKSSGFIGPGASATLAHANVNKKANKLQLKLTGGFESQWGKSDSSSLGRTSYLLGISSSLVIPRLILPFPVDDKANLIVSRTLVNLGYEFTNKIKYYRMSAVKLGMGYQWSRKQKISHVFYPVNLNLVNLLKTTPEFDDILNNNPYVRKSFEEEFIAGMKYDFIYDNTSRKSYGFYTQLSLGIAGNLVDLFKTNSRSDRPYTVFGNVYSQFIKVSSDIRLYLNTTKQGFIFRLYTGAGFSYGNSTVMPYIEQFYSGGANSLRAFIARSLGPGDYRPVETSGLIDQTGDIKVEGNIEYRFPFSSMLKGALFLDAGNVWLLNEDENRPGSNFKFGTFMNQLAVGTGFGLRFDFNFFVLRTDIGFPLRTPYAKESGHWVTGTKDFFSGSIFNLAIGYPF